MNRAQAAETAKVVVWTLAISLATALGTALCSSASFAAGVDYHTQDSQDSRPGETTQTPQDGQVGQTEQSTQADSDLEAQLAHAREQLEQAANRVAELSARLYGAANQRFVVSGNFGPGRVFRRGMVGLQLDPQSGANGARVLEVSPGGPAADSGVRSGDIIVAVNGAVISGPHAAQQVVERIGELKPNTPVRLRVMRDGQTRQLELTVRPQLFVGFPASQVAGPGQPMPPMPPMPPASPGPGAVVAVPAYPNMAYFQALTAETAGMELTAVTPALGKYFGTDEGVLVIRAPTDDAFHLQDGDVILAIDGRKPLNGTHATRILSSYQPGERITLRIMRQRKPMSLTITLPGAPPGTPAASLPEPAPR